MLQQIDAMQDEINAALRKPAVVRGLFRDAMRRDSRPEELQELLEMGRNPPWLMKVGPDEVLEEMLALAPVGAVTLREGPGR